MAGEIDAIIPRSLTNSLKETFSIQASTPIEITKLSVVEPHTLQDVDLIAAIGLTSSAFTGTLALCFPGKPFLAVISRMLGEDYTEITIENSDAIGELLNIVYASARVKMNQGGHDFSPAIPTVIRGSHIQISHGNAAKIIRVECKCEFGPFYLEVSLRKTGK